jgi:AraC family transcriptional regulator, arabinose operon regulatory protein
MPSRNLLSVLWDHTIRINCAPQTYHCEPAWRWQPPPLSDCDLWYAMDGAGEMSLDGQTFRVLPGRCFLLQPGDRIDARHDPHRPLSVFAVHFDLLDDRARPLRKRLSVPPIDVQDAGYFHSLVRRCEIDWRHGNETGKQCAQNLVRQMLLHLQATLESNDGDSDSDQRVAKVIQQVRQNSGFRRSVQQLADDANLSRSQLTRRFIRAVRMSPEAFLIQARVDRARFLLGETRMSMESVAESLGYCDMYYFYRQFKSVTGQTPGQFRGAATHKFQKDR